MNREETETVEANAGAPIGGGSGDGPERVVIVGASLRSVSHPDVFAAGDSAWPTEPVGSGPVRPSTYTATILGAHAGGNVARDLTGKPVKPLRFGYAIQSISLGHKDGLAQLTDAYDKPFGWVVTGRMAVRIKESVERFLVVGPLRLERLVPGAFMWRPGATPMTEPRERMKLRRAYTRNPRRQG